MDSQLSIFPDPSPSPPFSHSQNPKPLHLGPHPLPPRKLQRQLHGGSLLRLQGLMPEINREGQFLPRPSQLTRLHKGPDREHRHQVPCFLSYNSDKYIKPKLEFFLTAGLSIKDLTKFISANPYILRHSLEKTVIPNFNQLKSILGGIKEAVAALGGASSILCRNPENFVLPNMKTLQEYGVAGPRIVKLAILYPRAFMRNTDKFSRSVKLVKEMGFDPSKVNFALGVTVVAGLSSSTWERKLQLYKSLEWSEDDVIVAFKKHPFCMLLSDDKIRKVMCFYVETLKLEPSYVAARPKLLAFSFEKRVLPRYMVLSVLESKGLIKWNIGLVSYLLLSEKKFVLQYVAKYQAQVPQVLETYQVKLDLTNLRAAQSSLNQHVVAVNGSCP